MQNESDVQYGVEYGTPIQGGEEKVTRQTGIDPALQQLASDPVTLPEIVQGDHEVVAYRNPGSGAQFFGRDGTLYSDHRSDDSTFFADRPAIAGGDQLPPPGLARRQLAATPALAATDVPVPPPPAFVQADQPGNNPDPRDLGGPAKVFSASALPVIPKHPIVPIVDVDVIASGAPTVVEQATKPVRAKAAPKAKKKVGR